MKKQSVTVRHESCICKQYSIYIFQKQFDSETHKEQITDHVASNRHFKCGETKTLKLFSSYRTAWFLLS